MRHLKRGRKLNRCPSHRWALMRNLVTSLLQYDRITTTDAKAKELRRWADWMVTLGKDGTLHARRQALAVIQNKAVVRRLFNEIAQQVHDRHGGYTRVFKVGRRRGDGAPMSMIELILGEDGTSTDSTAATRTSVPQREPAADRG